MMHIPKFIENEAFSKLLEYSLCFCKNNKIVIKIGWKVEN